MLESLSQVGAFNRNALFQLATDTTARERLVLGSSIEAAILHTRAQCEIATSEQRHVYHVEDVSRKGTSLRAGVQCVTSEDYEALRRLQSGTEVKFVSKDPIDCRDRARYEDEDENDEKDSTMVLDAEVKNVNEPDRSVQLKLRTPVKQDFWPVNQFQIHPKKKNQLGREKKAVTDLAQGYQTKDLPLAGQSFLQWTTDGASRIVLKASKKMMEEFPMIENFDGFQARTLCCAIDDNDSPFLFAHGGPGSGKTTVTSEVIRVLSRRGKKVLVLSETNLGAQTPALMIEKRERQLPQENRTPMFIAGNQESSVKEKHLRKFRMRRGLEFPEEEFKALSARDLKAELLESQHGMVEMEDVQRYRKHLKQQIEDSHKRKIQERLDQIKEQISGGGVVYSTFDNLPSDKMLDEIEFDVIIVDEATKARPEQLASAIKKANGKIIFVGDPRQLGNVPLTPEERETLQNLVALRITETVNSLIDSKRSHEQAKTTIINTTPEFRDVSLRIREKIEAEGITNPSQILELIGDVAERIVEVYEEGPFTSLISASPDPDNDLPYIYMPYNRRSLPNIVKLSSKMTYGDKMLPGREPEEGEDEGVVEFIDTGLIETKERSAGTSKRNAKEADVVVKHLLDKLLGEKVEPEDLGVIAMYAEQAELIKDKVSKILHGEKHRELLERLLPNINTVDAFQGSERKIVFVSLTRSSQEEKSVGFLEEERRMGVAISRAQDKLFIIGDRKTITANNPNPQSRSYFEKLIASVTEVGTLTQEKVKSPRKPHHKKHKKHS